MKIYLSWRDYPELEKFSDQEKPIVWFNFIAEEIEPQRDDRWHSFLLVLAIVVSMIFGSAFGLFVLESAVAAALLCGLSCGVAMFMCSLAFNRYSFPRTQKKLKNYIDQGRAKKIPLNESVKELVRHFGKG